MLLEDVTTCEEFWRGFPKVRPESREGIARWVEIVLGVRMPREAVCGCHQTPLDYLEHSFLELAGDAVVWACRGGGKTTLGAVATLLDLTFKPGVQVRILGGSFEQSEKMYSTLQRLVRERCAQALACAPTQRRMQFRNGSRVEVLAQSDRAVRGQRVQKLRCDEVELFDPAVWQAAQLTTRSVETSRGEPVRGTLEAFSTMHRPAGLMRTILQEADQGAGRRTFAWCIWEVIEKCPAARPCDGCALWEDCRGIAKRADGFVPVEDVIAMKSRVSRATWEHEMLCHAPRVEHGVFPAFRRERHVAEMPAGMSLAAGGWVVIGGRRMRVERVIAGVDFGYRGAFVCVWLALLREGERRVVYVFDELVVREQTLARNIAAMQARGWTVQRVYCDVAGKSTNSQTGRSDEQLLREAGYPVRSQAMAIAAGLGMVNDLLDPAEGLVRLMVHPRCVRLIAAFEGYERGENGTPIKDGTHDHPIDALRYAIVGADGGGKAEMRYY